MATGVNAFIRMPYAFSTMAAMGAIFGTTESSIPWNRFHEFHAGVMRDVQKAGWMRCVVVACCRAALPMSIPTVPAPYFTFTGMGQKRQRVGAVA